MSSSKINFHFSDELLEDLQSTVAPRPTVNGNATGYRQTYKTFTTQKSGYPAETSKECEIEYLNPSNTTSVITERSKSPFFDKVRYNPRIKTLIRITLYNTFLQLPAGEHKFDQW